MSVNNQNFYQMRIPVNSMGRQSTGIDSVVNLDTDYVSVAQQKVGLRVAVSGPVVSFETNIAAPLLKCIADIDPVQAGTGDPSPDNVRPITGWTGCNITISPTTAAQDGSTYNFDWQTDAGTVYGGNLSVYEDGSGKLLVDRVYKVYDGSEDWHPPSPDNLIYFALWRQPPSIANIDATQKANWAKPSLTNNNRIFGTFRAQTNGAVVVYNLLSMDEAVYKFANEEEFKTYLTTHPLSVCYKIAEPIEYNLTDLEVLETLNGANNIWADTGNISIEYLEVVDL